MIINATNNNIIGTNGDGNGFDANERNLISGNGETGIFMSADAISGDPDQRSDGNIIAGNFIGVDVTGNVALGNGSVGNFNRAAIWLDFGTSNTIIGTNGDGIADDLERNIISGGNGPGIIAEDENTTDNIIAGNYIGIGADGMTNLGNGSDSTIHSGIRLADVQNFRIGTNGDGVSDALERNIISGNAANGIELYGIRAGADNTVVAGNYIGTDAFGTSAISNAGAGIYINQNASGNRIGTNADGISDQLERNVIAGNGGSGVFIRDGNAIDNVIAGNYIGVDATGNNALGNGSNGVQISFATSDNLVGTDGNGNNDSAERNIIAGNVRNGVTLVFGADLNTIAGNYIGSNASGTTAIANGAHGVAIGSGATDNTIGGSNLSQGNYIVGNTQYGIRLNTNGSNPNTSNTVAYNSIGLSPYGQSLPNDSGGIEINNITSGLVRYNRIYNHTGSGIILKSGASVSTNSNNNCIVNNTAGFTNNTSTLALFENNWWGDASGPSGSGGGLGDAVSTNVDFDPFLTVEPAACQNITAVGVDVNRDGIVSPEDAIFVVNRIIADTFTADVDGDGDVDTDDIDAVIAAFGTNP